MANDVFKNALPSAARLVWQLLRDNMNSTPFKAYYYGDPVLIPESLLPCIIVDTLTTDDELGASGYDDVQTGVMIKVVFNKKDDFNGSPDAALTKQKVEFYTEGRSKEDGRYLPFTVKGILRKHVDIDGDASSFTSHVDYDVIIRPEDSITQESHTTLTISSSIRVERASD